MDNVCVYSLFSSYHIAFYQVAKIGSDMDFLKILHKRAQFKI